MTTPSGPRVLERIAETRQALDQARATGATVGLVPTMGYLHEGHASLLRRARVECDVVLMSLFVNPLQFGAGEDLADYPRDRDRDLALAAAEGVDLVLAPTVEEMYPEPVLTTVAVPALAATLEGASRPTHFAGVATVVAKLFSIAGPCRAYFGEKDYQQLAIVARMAADLSMPVEVVGCPIVREPDGLALSSRNVYLSPDERRAAPVLHRALLAGRQAVAEGQRDAAAVCQLVAGLIRAEPLAELDYVALVDGRSLAPLDTLAELDAPAPLDDRPRSGDGSGAGGRLLVAARFGRPRLLDNLSVLV